MPSKTTAIREQNRSRRLLQRSAVIAHRRVRRVRDIPTASNVSYFYNSRGQLFKSVILPLKKQGEWELKFTQFVRGKQSDVGRAFLELDTARKALVIAWVDKTSAVMRSIDPASPITDRGIEFFRVVVEASIKQARQSGVHRLLLIATPSLAKYYAQFGFRKLRDYSPGREELEMDFRSLNGQ